MLQKPVHAEVLSRAITRQRHNLLKMPHANGPLSVRDPAALLERDYKNVHQDVKILEESGMPERDSRTTLAPPTRS